MHKEEPIYPGIRLVKCHQIMLLLKIIFFINTKETYSNLESK